MKYILSRGNRHVLQQVAWSNVLVAFDYDGTLAPIVSDPQKATMRRETRHLLEQLAKAYPCVIISGRTQADALGYVRGVGFVDVVGNHGIEPLALTRRFSNRVRLWRPILEKKLAGLAGVSIEDKVFSLAVHYRRSREKKKARAAILSAAASLGKVRIIGGKQVVNVLPPGAPHKGTALERVRAKFGCDTAIYVGDDETDEDIFTLDQPGRLLTIRVGTNGSSFAAYYLRNQTEVDSLLRILVDLRTHGARQHRAG